MYSTREITSDTEWEEITRASASYPQSILFKNIQDRLGRNVERFVIKKSDKPVGYFQAIVYPLYKDMTSIYIPYGPVLHETNQDIIDVVTDTFKSLAQKHKAVYVRGDFDGMEDSSLLTSYKKISGFAYKTVYHQPRGEWILDITPDEGELLEAMHKKTRYNLKKSFKQGLETSFVHGAGLEEWADTFIALNEQNMQSHGTTTHTRDKFKVLFSEMAKRQENFIAVTRKDNHVLAINLFVKNGNSVFCPFGASNDLGKQLGAYYHIKWHAILEMKRLGITEFNWGGISVGLYDQDLTGVTQFKKGFGGYKRNHGELYDLVVKPFWYYLYMFRKKFI